MGWQVEGPGPHLTKILEDAAKKVSTSKPKDNFFFEKGLVDQFYLVKMIRS